MNQNYQIFSLNSRKILLFVLFACSFICMEAQEIKNFNLSLNNGEVIDYDIYFKWGIIMPRAGEATFSFEKNYTVKDATSKYNLTFKSVKFFDNFFKMRDTLDSYFNDEYKLIYSRKAADEGGYYLVDEIRLNHNPGSTTVKSCRYDLNRVKIDTVMMATGNVTDMLGAVFAVRGIDRKSLKSGDRFPMVVAIGRDMVKIQLVYHNQAIIERDNMKYNTRYFKIDIFDDAFESTTTSAEVWVGDDDNFIPVKVRSKLKIGYVEVYYKRSKELAHPLSCGIKM
jgi:hypothetical protein